MGWSCRADAAETMDAWTAACIANSGSQNEYTVGGSTYFWELSNREHDDGAITGRIMKVVPGSRGSADGSFLASPAGTFRIEGDGTVTRAPKFLKDAAKKARVPGDLSISR